MKASFEKLKTNLLHLYSDAELQHIFYTIAIKITGLSRVNLLANKNTIFSAEQNQIFEAIIKKLKSGAPLQYVLGEAWFYGMRYKVNASVLIPRPETEELVEWIVNENMNCKGLKIIDIGTGSGCIAISLKSVLPDAEITATDISEAALATAKQNASENNVDVKFLKADITRREPQTEFWDIIVSNPPYITDAEKQDMHQTVIHFEPHTALFTRNKDSLHFYRMIAEYASEYLISGGKLYFEINQNAGESCRKMLGEYGFRNIELRKDISGNDRMIRAQK